MSDDKLKILIVDDEMDICNILADFLEDLGYAVETAFDGMAAIEKVKEGNFSLVLLDWNMPVMDGFETLQAVKQIQPGLGVIVATGLRDEALAYKAIQAGAYDFIVKPFDFKQIELIVNTYLATED